jgi:hypothetical protein
MVAEYPNDIQFLKRPFAALNRKPPIRGHTKARDFYQSRLYKQGNLKKSRAVSGTIHQSRGRLKR